mgnify:CR=1 FL=1
MVLKRAMKVDGQQYFVSLDVALSNGMFNAIMDVISHLHDIKTYVIYS